MPRPALTEFVAPPPDARVYSDRMWPGLGDCAPSGRVRLDALARWLQDIAYADVEDAGLADSAVWVVRRTRMRIAQFPRFAERCTVSTYCSGVGRMWAERRTTIVPDTADGEGNAVEAVALWVHLDQAGRPTPFEEREIAQYGNAAVGRRVSARLRQPHPTATAQRSSWIFRATECDLARHINNAAYWQAIEEVLLGEHGEPTRLDAEMEFRTPSQPGEKLVLRDGEMGWIVGPDGATHASVVLKPLA